MVFSIRPHEGTAWRCDSSPRGHVSVESGSPQRDAKAVPTPRGTYARVVGSRDTELRTVLERSASRVWSPYRVEVFEEWLGRAGLGEEYATVVDGLRWGFDVGYPRISRTQVPPNRPSVDEFRTVFEGMVEDEVGKGRYVGPVSRAELEETLGPFQCSPISVIPKSTPGKFRIIQNFSFPHAPNRLYPAASVNSHTDASRFPCTWGTFAAVAHLIWSLPPGSEMAVRDVSEAYRGVPLRPSQWAATVVGLGRDRFCVDLFAAFGGRPSGGVYGMVADAAVDLMRWRGIGPVTKWVDDHIFVRMQRRFIRGYNELRERWRLAARESGGKQQKGGRIWFLGERGAGGEQVELFEECRFPVGMGRREREDGFGYGVEDIDEVSDALGIRWGKAKDQLFASSGTFIGLHWSIARRAVSLPDEKRDRYLESIRDWQLRSTHSLLDVQQLYGRLLHAALVVPEGRARLVGLESMLGTFRTNPFARKHPPAAVGGHLRWWANTLRRPQLERPLGRMFPASVVDIGAYSDASTGGGIGIVVAGRWRAWRLLPGWTSLDGVRDILWAEAVGFELLVRFVVLAHPPGTHIKVYGDNQGVVDGWRNRRSKNGATNGVFISILDFLDEYGSAGCIHAEYVPSAENPADGPSRGILPDFALMLDGPSLPRYLERFVVDASHPVTAAERANSHKRHGDFLAIAQASRLVEQEESFDEDDLLERFGVGDEKGGNEEAG